MPVEVFNAVEGRQHMYGKVDEVREPLELGHFDLCNEINLNNLICLMRYRRARIVRVWWMKGRTRFHWQKPPCAPVKLMTSGPLLFKNVLAQMLLVCAPAHSV